MGFGLLALGYIFLTFYTTGADLVGYVIMLIALKKLMKIEKSFKKSIFAVILLIPVGLFNLFVFADTVFDWGMFRNYDYQVPVVSIESSSSETEALGEASELVSNETDEASESDEEDESRKKMVKISEAIFNAIFIFGSLCFHYFFYQSVRKLCMKTEATKLGFKACRNMAINIVFFSVWGFLTAGGTPMVALNIVTILHFPIIILNFIYIYSCYTTFAIEDETENDEIIKE